MPANFTFATFAAFSAAHLAALVLVAALAVAVAAAARHRQWLGWALAVLLLIQEVVKIAYFVRVAGEQWEHALPLAICRVNELLCIVMLVRRSYRIFEVAYFWALAASVPAMLSPALMYGFPHPQFLLFFLGHGLVVLAVVYAIAAWRFEPSGRSVVRALLATGAYALVIAPVNLLLDTNYLYLRHKPEAATVVDLLGPWPYYLVGLCILAVLLCVLCWVPFAVLQRRRGQRGRSRPGGHSHQGGRQQRG